MTDIEEVSEQQKVWLERAVQNGTYVEEVTGMVHAAAQSGRAIGQANAVRNFTTSLPGAMLVYQQQALNEAADAIQAMHPGEEKNSVTFLRERAKNLKPKEIEL